MITPDPNPVSKLIALYGLAGSGKSSKLHEFKLQGYQDFDDFMGSTIKGKNGFAACSHLEKIISLLSEFKPCIIADMQMGQEEFRRDVERTLKARVPTLSIEWHCMDCSTPEAVAKCLYNAYYRSKEMNRDFKQEAWLIDVFSQTFTVQDPQHAYPVKLKQVKKV